MMDSKLDIAAESMKTAGTGIGAWSQAFSDLNVGLSYADEAVYMCAASQYGTPTTYGNLAFGYSQVARDWGNLAKEQLGQCLPFF